MATIITFTVGYIFTVVLLLINVAAVLFKSYSFVYFITILWANCLFGLAGKRLNIYGRKNIENGKPYIVLCNHSSFYDIPAIMSIQPNIAWIARSDLFKIPVFGLFIRLLGCIPVERNSFVRSGKNIILAVKTLIKNQSIGIFPEGTRTLDGNIQRFKMGFVWIMKNCKMDILPVTLNGFYKMKPKNRFTVHPKNKLEIIIHPPISYQELTNKPNDMIMEIVRQKIISAYRV